MPFSDRDVLQMLLKSMNEHEGGVSEETLVQHLKSPPVTTTVRINTLITNKESFREEVNEALLMQFTGKKIPQPIIEFHQELKDVLILKSCNTHRQVQAIYPQVIVGLQCATSVLRGSQVYAPGVTAIPSGLSVGDSVSVFADLSGQCKRGWNKNYEGPTCFVGNGLLVQSRQNLFTVASPRGLAVNMVEPLYDCPSIGDILLKDSKTGLQKGFLQNLPSVLCGHALNLKPHHTVLDMCAAPGGKTTHIACLMANKGVVIALDKSASKTQQVRDNATKLGLSNIKAFAFDSTKACVDYTQDYLHETSSSDVVKLSEPPFFPDSFDRILLDAPCSALGQRPQLFNPVRLKEVQSFARLQKKLFATAVRLLKTGGRMVYSTCTYNVAENEEMIDWALGAFPDLHVVSSDIQLGKPGYRVGQLKDEHCKAMQRFGSPCHNKDTCDTIGFFMCCLEKRIQ